MFILKSKISDVLSFGFLLGLVLMVGILVYYYDNKPNFLFNDSGQLTVELSKLRGQTGNAEIEITSEGFYPETLSVKSGWQVTWTNNDTVPHRVAIDPYPAENPTTMFDSEAIEPGESFTYTFKDAGTFEYHDDNNPIESKGTVIVTTY